MQPKKHCLAVDLTLSWAYAFLIKHIGRCSRSQPNPDQHQFESRNQNDKWQTKKRGKKRLIYVLITATDNKLAEYTENAFGLS